MKYILRWLTLVLVLAALALPSSARADVAPPGHPPGSNPEPGAETTQVRMVAETVLIDVLPGDLNQAKVTADFTMRNLGGDAENMAVRFPLSSNDGFGEYPEIKNLSVKVDGKTVSMRRIMQEDPVWGSDLVPWSEFDVTFPPGQDVQIQVTYIIQGTGESPYVAFYYIFHTGEGWKDSIGSADLIVRLPYQANPANVIFDEHTGWSFTTPGGVFDSNEVKWHFENLEPTLENDFEVSLIMPSAWQKVLNERANIENNPDDGEAWGRLGKLYKEIFFFRRGFRHDDGGTQLYQLSIEAYEKAVTLLPDDALWHAGFADLLAVHAYYASQEGENATAEMVRSMQEIDRALELSPNDLKVNEIAEEIYFFFPDAVQLLESGYDFLWLTATPIAQAPTLVSVSPTSVPEATTAASFTATAIPAPAAEAESTPTTAPSPTPVCGSALLLPLALLWFTRRKGKPLL
jgi:hypothetical protein